MQLQEKKKPASLGQGERRLQLQIMAIPLDLTEYC